MLVLMHMSKADPQALSNLVWACAKMGVRPAGGFTPAYIRHLQEMLPSPSPQHTSTSMWAYAVLKTPLSATLLEAAARRLQTLMPDLEAPDICQSATMYAHSGTSPAMAC